MPAAGASRAPLDAILPLVVVLANAGVSVFQEVRAKRKLDRIALDPPDGEVRDGRDQSVDPGEIVRGDLLVVGPGDQIVVDGTVVGDGTMEVDESQLTGESDLVRKRAGDELFSGSFCVTGGARFEAQRVGGNSFANQVTAGARAERRVLTPLQREINGVIRLTLLVAAFLMVVLTVSAVAWRDPFVELVQRLVVVRPGAAGPPAGDRGRLRARSNAGGQPGRACTADQCHRVAEQRRYILPRQDGHADHEPPEACGRSTPWDRPR